MDASPFGGEIRPFRIHKAKQRTFLDLSVSPDESVVLVAPENRPVNYANTDDIAVVEPLIAPCLPLFDSVPESFRCQPAD